MNKSYFREPETNKYVPSELTEEEKALSNQIRFLAAEQRRVEHELKAARSSCTHSIWYDVAGFPYDSRYCGVCGAHLETI